MKNSSIEDKMAQAFDGFEPEVQGQWSHVESKLDAQLASQNGDMANRVRSAQRFAIGATAVAAGLSLWMAYPILVETIVGEDVKTETSVMRQQNHENIASEGHALYTDASDWSAELKMDPEAPVSGSHRRMLFPERAARTSTSVKMSSADLDENEESTASVFVDADADADADAGQLVSIEKQDINPSKSEEGSSEKVELITVTLLSSVQEACEGTEVDFALEEFMDSGSILWNFGDGSFSQESTPSHVFDRPGSYDITVSVRSHENGYIRTKSIENMIVVRPKPDASMDWNFELNKGNGIEVQLVDATEKASSSTWVMTGQGLHGSRISIKEPGAYPVNLVVSNAYGCQDIAVGNIEVGDRHVAGAPAMFSPNGDGRYDEFLPEAANAMHAPWHFSVFNVEGELVFESIGAQKPWKGQLIGGGTVRIGERYFWNLELTKPDGSKSIHSDVVRIDG